MERYEISEEWILVEQFTPSVASSVSFVVSSEQVDDTMLNVLGNVCQVHLVTRAGRALAVRGEKGEKISFVDQQSERPIFDLHLEV